MSHFVQKTNRSRGAILMAVLGFVFLMAVFVTQFLEIATRQMRARAVELGRSDLRTTGYSAMEVTLAVLNEFKEIDEGINSPAQGWGDPIGYADLQWPAGVDIKVSIEDETGKLPLNPPPEADLKLLLDQLGIDLTDADIMVDSLMDWTDEDDLHRINGAEDSYYERQDPPLKPANGPLTSFETLRYIRGFDEFFFDEDGVPKPEFYSFTDAVSLHNTHKININTARPDVMGMLGESSGFDERSFGDELAGQDRIPGNDDDNIIRSEDDLRAAGYTGDSGGVGYEVAVAKINVDVSSGDKRFRLSALVELQGANNSNSNNENRVRDPDDDDGDEDNHDSAGQNSSGNSSNSPFTLIRLVENANFD
ncbi:type II secretion system protein GspK [Rubellicoccus peritrichatus]|uniref:Type II secretion system protein GspK n=1 Tax=Rubellicoccus peritrichatus TaxID=3080537 RepID=A0AAQ3QS65_9BACT|nr:type II secretion system protein GspK [Puniceicoccus sp. CR14]WOO40036.1 type II secretion system protein GspK [Puniceicoccus sp. CR14]